MAFNMESAVQNLLRGAMGGSVAGPAGMVLGAVGGIAQSFLGAAPGAMGAGVGQAGFMPPSAFRLAVAQGQYTRRGEPIRGNAIIRTPFRSLSVQEQAAYVRGLNMGKRAGFRRGRRSGRRRGGYRRFSYGRRRRGWR